MTSSKKFRWDEQNTGDLISIAREYQLANASPQEKQKLFFVVLERGMQQNEYQVTRSEIKAKWRKLKEEYFREKKQPDSKMQGNFFVRMEQIITGDPQLELNGFTPTVTALSQQNAQGSANSPLQESYQLTGLPLNANVNIDKEVNNILSQIQGEILKRNGSATSENDAANLGASSKLDVASHTKVSNTLPSTSTQEANGSSTSTAAKEKQKNSNGGKKVASNIISSECPSVKVILDGYQNPDESDDAFSGPDESILKTADNDIYGAEAYMSNEDDEPERKRRKRNSSKKGGTNTDRIIDAMVAEGQKDRAILRQFMREFTSSAKALTHAIQQIAASTEVQDDNSDLDEV